MVWYGAVLFSVLFYLLLLKNLLCIITHSWLTGLSWWDPPNTTIHLTFLHSEILYFTISKGTFCFCAIWFFNFLHNSLNFNIYLMIRSSFYANTCSTYIYCYKYTCYTINFLKYLKFSFHFAIMWNWGSTEEGKCLHENDLSITRLQHNNTLCSAVYVNTSLPNCLICAELLSYPWPFHFLL